MDRGKADVYCANQTLEIQVLSRRRIAVVTDHCFDNEGQLPVKLFPHQELKFYSFGFRAGVLNLLSNGLRLGARKTIGKITQPINAHSRFPEYYWFEAAIRAYQCSLPPQQRIRILDVGSPKMLGLYLGCNTQAEVTLTDISELNVDEYRTMWRGLEANAKGTVLFSLQDARSLEYPDSEFDIVYSMSVVEHIEGEEGDSRAVRELLRVLKPGGLLVLSVPFGAQYVEQKRIGFSGAARKTGDHQAYFFQRIYDAPVFQKRILDHAAGMNQVTLVTVERRHAWLSRAFGSLGENIRGVLGFMNPLLSVAINRSSQGIDELHNVNYGQFHSSRDVYGDLILTAQKN
jgi:SAM-dependent methyltransferase